MTASPSPAEKAGLLHPASITHSAVSRAFTQDFVRTSAVDKVQCKPFHAMVMHVGLSETSAARLSQHLIHTFAADAPAAVREWLASNLPTATSRVRPPKNLRPELVRVLRCVCAYNVASVL